MNIKETTSPNSITGQSHTSNQGLTRLGQQLGFSQQADELRERLGVRKSDLKRNGDVTHYSKILNGHNVPGWGEEAVTTLESNSYGSIIPVNRGRNQIKEYVKTLLANVSTTTSTAAAAAPSPSAPIYREEVVALVNRLLEAAEYTPLNPQRNQDDKYLLGLIARRYPAQELSPAAKAHQNLTELGTELKYLLSEEVETLLQKARLDLLKAPRWGLDTAEMPKSQPNQAKPQAEVIFFKSGVPKSRWYRQIKEDEDGLEGERLYYGGYLTVFATPPDVRVKFAQSQGWNEYGIKDYLASREERLREWKHQLAHYPHRDIYDRESLAQELRGRTFRGVRISQEEVAERVRLACEYLDTYPNFEIGLSPQKLNFHFQIKAGQLVLMEGRREYPADQYNRLFGVRLSGQYYVSYFRQLFEELWQEAVTDKETVKKWLREQSGII